MRKGYIAILLMIIIVLSACTKPETITIPECQWEFTQTMGEQIPVASFEAPQSTVIGNTDNFINICKPLEVNPLFLKDSKIKSHHLIFEFDSIYPIERIEFTNYVGEKANSIEKISIEASINGTSFQGIISDYKLDEETSNIDLKNRSARKIRISFRSLEKMTFGIQDIKFFLGEGLIVKEDHEWTDAFLRYEHWTGADGIFSFNMNGNDAIGASAAKTGFIFSDTFTGPVNPFNGLRNSNRMINNSVGYYNGSSNIKEGMSFDYRLNEQGQSVSAFLPNSYIGYKANNLLDNDGLSIYQDKMGLLTNEANGIMWLSPVKNENFIKLDFYESQSIANLYLWNYNGNPLYGVKKFSLSYSVDHINWIDAGEYLLDKASGNADEPYTKAVTLNIDARYLKIKIIETYDFNQVGLGKILLTNSNNQALFASISASGYDDTISGNEISSRLWLQDGVVIGDYLYIFPILVKDESTLFKVTRVGLIKVPIVNELFDFENAIYLDSPLQSRSDDGGIIYYGAGLMNHTAHDGYLYIYGYKDLHGRHLTVARVKAEDIENFNRWTYFDGVGWSHNINDSYPLIDKVSPELSVTYLESGMFSGKYMLVVTENSISGRVSYALSDTPYGPFSDYTLLYEATEYTYLKGAFGYNAKMHPHLSQEGNYLISYNVNTHSLSALQNVNIYRPRFIRVIEVKKQGE